MKPSQSCHANRRSARSGRLSCSGHVAATLLLSGLGISSPMAAGTQENPGRLDPLVVEASRTGQAITELPQTTQVIDAAQVERQLQSGATLSEALGKLVPGLGPSSQTLTNFTQTLRGRDPLYLIDGVSLNSARAISRQINSLHPDQIERIEVISGATAIYGAGGAGGIINIVTKSAARGV